MKVHRPNYEQFQHAQYIVDNTVYCRYWSFIVQSSTGFSCLSPCTPEQTPCTHNTVSSISKKITDIHNYVVLTRKPWFCKGVMTNIDVSPSRLKRVLIKKHLWIYLSWYICIHRVNDYQVSEWHNAAFVNHNTKWKEFRHFVRRKTVSKYHWSIKYRKHRISLS